ncbi:MAG: hypothetical protein DWQ07_22025 [Chloroflexi bacterium]|nr:MAG: hypothetical protein DWQ07_22025 [Chloroflexota bacterium]MBL1196367.1 hypothetical protein [Chloroflexota bacterium]NOH13662.1 hypothetical protein [Chloroflexota bacterium]
MTARRIFVPLLWLLAILLLIGIAVGLVFFIFGRQGQRTLPAIGPTVLITSPTPSDAATPSVSVLVEATVYGENPIHHIELWMDGELKQTFYNQEVATPAPVDISFTPILTAGDHILFVRAVDTHSLIGQSSPIMALGDGSIVGEGPFEMVSISPGDSLEETVASHDADLSTVLAANPNISTGGAPPGTVIAIPRPENAAAQNPPPAATSGNANFLEITQILPANPLPLQMIPMRALGPPTAPSAFTAEVNGCDLTFSWNDTSEDEVGFNIWMTGLGVTPHIAARTEDHPQTGTVTTVLSATRSGSFVYWVEAANVFGAQPSNQVKVTIDPPCPNTTTDNLTIEVLDFSSPGQYDRAYCYISVENAPEMRMPAAKDQFIPILAGKADMAKWPLASRSFQVVPPADQELNLQGECWGWAAGALTKLGTFSSAYPQAQWDGTRHTLADANFEIGFSMNISTNNKMVLYSSPDPGIPSPYDVVVPDKLTDISPSAIADPSKNQRTVTWKWNGDPTKIDGFTVMVGDIPFKQINDPNARQMKLELPGFCDTLLNIHVVAFVGDKHSLPSNKVTLHSRDCQFYAEVDFDDIFFDWTHDSHKIKVYNARNCDSFELWFELSVTEYYTQGDPPNMQKTPGRTWVRYFGSSDDYTGVRCRNTKFDTIGSKLGYIGQLSPIKSSPGTFVIPIYGGDNQGRFYEMEAKLWDYDSTSSNDLVAHHKFGLRMPVFEMNQITLYKLDAENSVFHYYSSPDGAYDYTNSGNSQMDLYVNIYRQSPSTGGSTIPTYPNNSPPTPTPTDQRGINITPRADLEATSLYVGTDGLLHLRLQNNGLDDLTGHPIAVTLSGTTTQPQFPAFGRYTPSIALESGAITDLHLLAPFKLDPALYDYDITAVIAPIDIPGMQRFHDDQSANNTVKFVSQAGQLQAITDPIIADLSIEGLTIVKDYPNNQLHVTVRNRGPHALSQLAVTMECVVDEVLRLGGYHYTWQLSSSPSSWPSSLNANGTLIFKNFSGKDEKGVQTGFDANLAANWYKVSCELKSDGIYTDMDLKNNFHTEIIQ